MKNNIFLKKYRNDIDDIDAKIVKLINKRFKIIKKIAIYKEENSINVIQKGRWQQVLNKVGKIALKLGLEKNMILRIWEVIHEFAILKENDIIKKNL